MTTLSNNKMGESTSQPLTPKLPITIPPPPDHTNPSRHRRSSSSSPNNTSTRKSASTLHTQPYLYPNPNPTPTSPYHGIRQDICSEDEKYCFMSEPSVSEDSPSSSIYTPQSSPGFGNIGVGGIVRGGRKTLAPVDGGSVEESKTCVTIMYGEDNDLSEEGEEDEELLRHLKTDLNEEDLRRTESPPPPPPPLPALLPPKNSPPLPAVRSEGNSISAILGEHGEDRSSTGTATRDRLDSREQEQNSDLDLSYDDSSLDIEGDMMLMDGSNATNCATDLFLTAIQETHRSPNGVEEGRKKLCTDAFLTAIQEIDKSPNLVELEGRDGSKYVDGDVVSGRKDLLLEPGFDRSDSMEYPGKTVGKEEEGKRSILEVEDSMFPVEGCVDWRLRWQQQQQQQVERGGGDASSGVIGQADSVDLGAVSSMDQIRTSSTARRSHRKHKKPQSSDKDREKDCHLNHLTKTNNDTHKTYNNDQDCTKNTQATTLHNTTATTTTNNINNNNKNNKQRNEPTPHADEYSDHLARLADDEQIRFRSRRRRLHSTDSRQTKKRPPGHRRTRSGDDAAATLLTGGTEWIGMELDELPLPLPIEDDDEDDVFELAMRDVGGVGGENEDAGSGIGAGGSRGGGSRRPGGRFGAEGGSDRSSAGRRSGASGKNHNNTNNNGENGGTSRESRRKSKQQSSSLKKQKEQGVAPREKSHGPPAKLLDVGTVGDSDDAGNQQQKQRRQQQNQPDWFDLSNSNAPSFEDNYHINNNNNNNNNSNNNFTSRKSSNGIENSDESEFLLSPSSLWAYNEQQQQQHQHQHQHQHHNNNSNISNINNSIPRPLYDRQESIGDASISTIDSQGSHSVFSWISNKISVTASSASKHDYQYHGSSRKDNTDASLNFSDDEDHHGGTGCSVKDENDLFRVPDSTDEMGTYLKRDDQMRRISPNGNGAIDSQFLRHQQRGGSVKGKERHTRTHTPEFLPTLASSVGAERKKYPMYTCPRCKVERRMFFTVNTAPNKLLEDPAAYLGICIGIYMLVSLTILGLEEGWPRLDCIYFSVMTLTTSGLGDYVPSSNWSKVLCSILIYFGIAFIGLLLGTLQANSLDDVCRKADKESMINNCPNCACLNSITSTTNLQGKYNSIPESNIGTSSRNISEDETSSLFHDMKTDPQRISPTLQTINETNYGSTCTTMDCSNTIDSSEPNTPFSLINRQSHTRHSSFDDNDLRRNFADQRTVNMVETDDSSVSTGQSIMSNAPGDGVGDSNRPVSRVKAAKYVFLTMKQAVANTVLIIVIGTVGFYYIEQMTLVDAFYFTMVLLTAVGYGDILPVTQEGKLFTSMYCLVAGFVVLKNVSMISTIPLELRKRRLERAVLTQFGDELDDAALRELATGPIVRRLQISEDQPDALDKCTREMFALAMLVRLGRITEQDVKLTYAAFQKLDKDHDGVLTSKEIIMSMAVERRKKNGMRGLSLTSRERDSGGGEVPRDGGNLQSMDYLSKLSHPLTATQNISSGRQTSFNGRQTMTPDFFQPRVISGHSIESQCSVMNHDDIMESGGGTDYRNLV